MTLTSIIGLLLIGGLVWALFLQAGASAQSVQTESPGADAPGSLESALRRFSQRYRFLAPFMAQNLGWFVGGFMFVSGSVFLVGYTDGGVRALIVSLFLYLYATLLSVGAYQMVRRNPELRGISKVLTTLAMMLIPLSIAASVRLVDAGGLRYPVWTGAGVLLVLINLGSFFWLARLGSGFMDRSLQHGHPRLFLALCLVQAAAPILGRFPAWPVMAGLHLLLLGMVAYSLRCFLEDWLCSIFLDQNKTAFYAAGTLVYAGLVSFVHLSWRYPAELPAGYAGPFLMALCGLLFYTESGVKAWTARGRLLSGFTFGGYALSVVALFWAAGTFWPLCISLVAGSLVYGALLWQYRTLPPLYLFLGCLGWLYHLVILGHFPGETHFLLALPGLYGLALMTGYAQRRRAVQVTRILGRFLTALALATLGWSLYHGQPGWTAMISAWTATALLYALIRFGPARFLYSLGGHRDGEAKTKDRRNSPWFYAVPASATLALAYAPRMAAFSWKSQFALALLLAAAIGTRAGLREYFKNSQASCHQARVLLNWAICCIPPSLYLIALDGLHYPLCFTATPIWFSVLAISATLLSWQAIQLRIQALAFLAIPLWAGAYLWLKFNFLLSTGTGITESLLLLPIWGLLVWLGSNAPARRTGSEPPKLRLLNLFSATCHSLAETVKKPLGSFAALLWIGAMYQLLVHGFLYGPTLLSTASAATLTLSTALLNLHFKQFRFWHLPLILGWGTGLSLIQSLTGASLAVHSFWTAAYGLTVWRFSPALFSWPRPWGGWLGYPTGSPDSKALINKATYKTAYGLILLALMGAGLGWLADPGMGFLPTLLVSALFFGMSGYRYRIPAHGYAVMAVMVGMTAMVQTGATPLPVAFLDPANGLSYALLSLTFCALSSIPAHRIPGDPDRYQQLWYQPLCRMALLLSLATGLHQVWLITGHIHHYLLFRGFPHIIRESVTLHASLTMALASAGVLLANREKNRDMANLAGLFMGAISLLWLEFCLLHKGQPFVIWPDSAPADLWLSLAVLGTAASALSFWKTPMAPAFVWLGAGLQIPALFGGLAGAICFPGDPVLIAAFIVLTGGGFPLVQSLIQDPSKDRIQGEQVRGPWILICLSAAWFGGLEWLGPSLDFGLSCGIWAYLLLLSALFVVPALNHRFARHAIHTALWPWVGLALLISGPLWSHGLDIGELFTEHWQYSLSLAVYLYLLLEHAPFHPIHWLGTGLLAWSGIPLLDGISPQMMTIGASLTASVAWTNILLIASWAVPRFTSLESRWKFKPGALGLPFQVAAGILLYLLMGITGLVFIVADPTVYAVEVMGIRGLVFGLADPHSPGLFDWVFLLLTGSFFHGFWLKPHPITGHSLILSAAVMVGYAMYILYPGFQLPLLTAVFTLLLYAAHQVLSRAPHQTPRLRLLRRIVDIWLLAGPWISVALLPAFPIRSLAHTLTVLAISAGVLAALGWERRQTFFIWAAGLLGLILLHTWPTALVPSKAVKGLMIWQIWPLVVAKFEQLKLLFPWYGLQLALAAWGLFFLRRFPQNRLGQKARSLKPMVELMHGLAICQLALHFLDFAGSLGLIAPFGAWMNSQVPPLIWTQWIAALSCAGLILAWDLRKLIQTENRLRFCKAVALLGGMGLYIRLLGYGLAPAGLVDMAVLLALAYTASMLRDHAKTRDLRFCLDLLALSLPVGAVFLSPLAVASPDTSAVLTGAGAVYLGIRYRTQSPVALYLGTAALNGALYLWIPQWASQAKLIQLYAAPAALSVLILSQLHKNELSQRMRFNIRLAGTSTLYLCAFMDFFLNPNFFQFALAIGLSLAGIIAGIGMRVRPFLFGGMIFLILNVLGQLFQFYPEETLGKGILLVALGTIVTGLMIGFTLRREAILRRIRIFRADLATWE